MNFKIVLKVLYHNKSEKISKCKKDLVDLCTS